MKRTLIAKVIAKVTLVLFALCAIAALYFNSLLNRNIHLPENNLPDSAYYYIKPGSSLIALINDLGNTQLISTPPMLTKIYALLTRSAGDIKAGEYLLSDELNTKSLLSLFRHGKVAQREITFPEGWTSKEWRRKLSENPYIKQTIGDMTDQVLMSKLSSTANYSEGGFFPDTYLFVRGSTDLSILQRAHKKMNAVLATEWEQRESMTLSSPRQALILASIVEKETAFEPDRVYIASVFDNRLQRGMRLQSDPTVIYGIENFDGNIRRKDLKRKSAHNTYVIKGLPATPICNPGIASIRASLNPPASSYYYFVARGDGKSEFSSTLAEHNAAVFKYQKSARVKDYRSTPKK